MSNLKILAVDDSPTMRRIIVNTLNRAGFNNVVEAEDGKDALAKLECEKIDFVITDWNMPKMDGLSMVTHIRQSKTLENLPVLMVTTRSAEEDIVKALKAGVNNYLVKPFTPDTLREKISQLVDA